MTHSQGNPALKESVIQASVIWVFACHPCFQVSKILSNESLKGKLKHTQYTHPHKTLISWKDHFQLGFALVSVSLVLLQTGSLAERRGWHLPFSCSGRHNANVGRCDSLSSSSWVPTEGFKQLWGTWLAHSSTALLCHQSKTAQSNEE